MRTFRCSAAAITACIILICSVTSFAASSDSSAVTIDSTTQPDAIVVDHNELMNLPFRSIEEVLGLQNGTTVLYQKQVEDISLTTPRISVRGSQPIETGYYLNGVQMNDPYSGYFTTRISPLALEQLTLEPTAFGAQNGFSGASAVRMVTRKGGSRYSGTFEAITDNTIGSDFDQNWYTATLGGPIPGPGNGRFFGCVERRYFGDRNPSSKTDDFLPGNPNRLPGNWLDGWAYNVRLDEQLRHNISLTGTLDGSITEWSQYIHSYYFDQQHLPYYKDENQTFSGQLIHQLTPTLDYALQVSYRNSERFRGDGLYRENLSAYRKPYVNWETDAYELFYSWDDMDGVTDGYNESHTWDDYLKYKSSQLNLRWDISKEIGQNHKFTFGAEYRRYTIRAYQNMNPTSPSGYYIGSVNHYGYDMYGNENDTGGTEWGNEVKHPKKYGVSLTDHMHFGDLELNPGLRLDVFDNNSFILKDASDPFGYNYVLDVNDVEKTSSNVRWSPRLAFHYAPTDHRFVLDGGYGLFYCPVSYSFLYAGRDFDEARIGNGSYYPVANPAIEPLKIRSFQIGFTYSFGDVAKLKLTGFDNETNHVVTITHISPAVPYSYNLYTGTGESRSWGLETNLELTIQKHIVLNASHALETVEFNTATHQSAYNIAWKNPDALANRPWVTSDYNQPHAFSVSLRYNTGEGEGPLVAGGHPLERFTLVVTEESSTGLPYTPMMPYNEVGFGFGSNSQSPTGGVNSVSAPNTTVVNLMLQREIPMAGMTITPFLWVTNLFDAETIYYVYSGTGEADNTGFLDTDYGKYAVEHDPGPYDSSGLNLKQKYELAQRDPTNYGPPRQVFFGLRVTF